MPACKNDPHRSYKGDEPSPKGVGLCAHAEAPWTVRMGRNGAQWYVAVSAKGVRSWKPYKLVVKTLKWDFGAGLGPLVTRGGDDLPVTKVRLDAMLQDWEPFQLTGSLYAYHPRKGSAYDDKRWLKAFAKRFGDATGHKFAPDDFGSSEMGMQGALYSHLDVAPPAMRKLLSP